MDFKLSRLFLRKFELASKAGLSAGIQGTF